MTRVAVSASASLENKGVNWNYKSKNLATLIAVFFLAWLKLRPLAMTALALLKGWILK